jgi:Arc/MetJ-type ribon-helix-helix transcriptional regulator
MTHDEANETVRGWFTGRLPQEWFTGPVEVIVDREEIAIIGPLATPETGEGASDAERAAAVDGRIKAFREDTRDRRIAIAREAEHRFGRKVAWGVTCDDRRALFTHLSVPVMTRLRQPERRVLDTLVEAGVARSRSEALAWAVRLVGQHSEDWLSELREAMEQVRRVREQGPESTAPPA